MAGVEALRGRGALLSRTKKGGKGEIPIDRRTARGTGAVWLQQWARDYSAG